MTLTGGNWNVKNGASLEFPAGEVITTNQADVSLSGAGATLPQLSPLASNSGSLTLSGGATFATSGDFDNSGTLTVGSSSGLSVAGNLTLEPASDLIVELGGTPSSAQFGTLKASGSAALGGTLGLELSSGYVPAATDSFPIVTYASQTGSFATIDRISPVAGQLLAVAVNASNVTITRTSGLTDLAVILPV